MKFQFQCLGVVMAYPDSVKENELFTKPKRLRDYTITLHAIQPSILQGEPRVVFGLLREDNPSMYMVAWDMPLSKLLFGPSSFVLPCSGTTERNVQYFIHFHNASMRVADYSLILHSIKVTAATPGRYSYS